VARRTRLDDGSVAIEAAIVVPPLLMLVCLAIAGAAVALRSSIAPKGDRQPCVPGR
jgi:Flp pilus assembly protein TadG